jgi:hypothetical protein
VLLQLLVVRRVGLAFLKLGDRGRRVQRLVELHRMLQDMRMMQAATAGARRVQTGIGHGSHGSLSLALSASGSASHESLSPNSRQSSAGSGSNSAPPTVPIDMDVLSARISEAAAAAAAVNVLPRTALASRLGGGGGGLTVAVNPAVARLQQRSRVNSTASDGSGSMQVTPLMELDHGHSVRSSPALSVRICV